MNRTLCVSILCGAFVAGATLLLADTPATNACCAATKQTCCTATCSKTCSTGACVKACCGTCDKAGCAACNKAAAVAGQPQTTCPVMAGNPINKKLFVDAEGKRIYVCCKGCLPEVQKDPKKYIQQMEAAGVTLEAAPAAKAAPAKP